MTDDMAAARLDKTPMWDALVPAAGRTPRAVPAVAPGRGITPVQDGDVLRSDGTTILGGDCKAGVSIILEALTSVVEAGGPHLPVEVAFSRAEEGGLVGVRGGAQG